MTPRKPEYRRPKKSKMASGDQIPTPKWETLMPMSTLDIGEIVETGSTPETQIQALMEAAPHQTPIRSTEERMAEPQRALAALHSLDELDQEIVRLRVFERMSVRNIARELDLPSHVWVLRRWDRIMSELQELLTTTDGDE